MADASAINILHPLAILEDTEGCRIPGLRYDPFGEDGDTLCEQFSFLNDKFFIGVSDGRYGIVSNVLLALSLDLKKHKRWSVPVWNFGLANFRSKLVIAGGLDRRTLGETNKLWVSEDGASWLPALPPMRVKRAKPSVVSVGDPECLVVAGGLRNGNTTDAVELLVGEQWFTVQRLPFPMDVQCSVHNGNLIAYDKVYFPWGYCCRVDSMLESCASKNAGGLWKKMDIPYSVSQTPVYLLPYGQQLVSAGDEIAALDPNTHKWHLIGHCPTDALGVVVVTKFPNGDLVYFFEGDGQVLEFSRVTMKLSPQDPEDELDVEVAERMELAGYNLLTSLAEHLERFKEIVGVTSTAPTTEESTPAESAKSVLYHWRHCKTPKRPPTWRSLLDVLNELGLMQLSQQNENSLTDVVPTLKETCMNVIMSNLLQQLNLNADQLQDRLPDYVPTTLRKAIVHNYKARTPI